MDQKQWNYNQRKNIMLEKYSKKSKYIPINHEKQTTFFNIYLTRFCLFLLIIGVMFWFYMQMKIETDDQIQHLIGLANLEDKKSQENKNMEDIKEVKEQTKSGNIKTFNSFTFEPILNWHNNKQIDKQTANLKPNEEFLTSKGPTQTVNNPINTNMHKTTQAFQSKPFPITPPVTPAVTGGSKSTLLRAGIQQSQIQFGKKLIRAKEMSLSSDLAQEQKKYYEQKYHISKYDELPFCIVIPSYNNADGNRYLHNLNSILQQDYSNYHIVFIDDASDDGTAQNVLKYAKDHQISENKMKIILNKERTMAMPNIYRAAKELCRPYEIFMIVDGDDELIGKQILKFFNSQFQEKKYWLMYTNFVSTRGTLGYSRPYSKAVIDNNNFRGSGFVISHLRAFYTKLLTLVKLEDLKDQQGKWYRAANDVAMYMPILEMVQKRHAYVPEICYLYNSNTGLNNHRVKLKEQKANDRKIKKKAHYQALEQLFTEQQKSELEKSVNNKIQIKDLSLPVSDKEVKKYGWQL